MCETEMGRGALRALEEFNFWVRDHLPTIQEYRRAYDDSK